MNNREKATLIWLAIALAAMLTQRELRGSLWQIVKSFLHPYVFGPVAALAAWTVGLVVLAHMVGLWENDIRSDTVVWFVTVGIAFFFSLQQVAEDGFFRRTFRRAIAGTVFVEVFVGLAVFPLGVELAVFPVVTLLVILAAFSEGSEELEPAHRFVNGVLGLVGVVLVGYVAVQLLNDLDVGHTVRALVLPVWLTLGTTPVIFAVGLWSAYQQAFIRIDLRTDDAAHRRRAKRALLRAAHLRAAEVGGFAGQWIWDLASAESSDEARAVMQRWRTTLRSERRAERMSCARALMRESLTEADPALAEIHGDAIRRSWERLDDEQCAARKAEGLRLASNHAAADDLRRLAA